MKNKKEIRQITNTEYHSIKDFIGSSSLKAWRVNPLKARSEEIERSLPDWTKPDAFKFGNYYHAYTNEPDIVEKEFLVFDESQRPFPDKNFGQLDNKKWKVEIYQEAEEKGLDEISMKDHEKVVEMKKVMFSHNGGIIKDIIEKYNRPEDSIFITNFITLIKDDLVDCDIDLYLLDNYHNVVANVYKIKDGWKIFPLNFEIDKDYSMNAKIRPDINTENHLGDLKSCTDNSVKGWSKQIDNFGYDSQGAYYHDVYECFTGKSKDFIWYSQEKKEPFNVEIYAMNEDWMSTGRQKYLYGAFRMLKYEFTGLLEGYHEEGGDVFAHDCPCPPWNRI